MKKFVFALTFAIIVILTMNFRCRKEAMIRPFDYEFTAEVDIYPLKKAYSLSDTIWIETDLPTKNLYDYISGQTVNADTCQIHFGASYNEFGIAITNPSNGFCQIISSNGNIVSSAQEPWATTAAINYGCGQSNFKCRIGFKPLRLGAYYISLLVGQPVQSCPSKVKPFYGGISYRYKNVDLNLDVYNSLPPAQQGGSSSFVDQINNREIFVLRVQ